MVKKIEKKVAEKIERKADRNVDKVLDKADRKTDKPIDEVLNSPRSKSDKPQTTPISSPPPSESSLVLMTENYSDFIWFRENSFMEFEVVSATGKVLHNSKMTVKKITNQGGMSVADVLVSDNKGNNFEMQYKGIGDKLYMDFGAMMREAMKKSGGFGDNTDAVKDAMSNTEIGFSDGFLSFPKKMYVGQNLDPISFKIASSATSQVKMEIVSMQQNRKVIERDKVETPAGTFDALKISSELSTNMKVMGINKKMPSYTEHIWFAPRIGVVKQLTYNEKGDLETMSHLIAYKF